MKFVNIKNLIFIATILSTICACFVAYVVYDEYYIGQDVTGTWIMYDTVYKSSLEKFIGLHNEFEVNFIQNSFYITGSGDKRKENGVKAKYNSFLSIDGHIKDNKIRVRFEEEGELRKSTGYFLWDVISDDTLVGKFRSTAGESSGSSKLVRISR